MHDLFTDTPKERLARYIEQSQEMWKSPPTWWNNPTEKQWLQYAVLQLCATAQRSGVSLPLTALDAPTPALVAHLLSRLDDPELPAQVEKEVFATFDELPDALRNAIVDAMEKESQ